jgi:predicted transcriptional regulator
MKAIMTDDSTNLTAPTARIVAAFVSTNSMPPGELPTLINTIHNALRSAGEPEVPESVKLTPAQIRRSITPDLLISFEDGKGYRSIKRHLTARGMTLAEYRAKWGLPENYPSTSPSYSAARSAMAKAAGLGQKAKTAAAPAAKSSTVAKKAVTAKVAVETKGKTAAPMKPVRPRRRISPS